MKIIIDFDRVAFDTNRLYSLLEDADIQPGTIESLEYLYPKDEEPIADLLFDDFKRFAQHQLSQGHELILVTSATGFSADWGLDYHTEKVRRSGVETYVSSVLPVADDKVETIQTVVGSKEAALFVDDTCKHLKNIKRAGYDALVCVHMVRSAKMRTAHGEEAVVTCEEFLQVADFDTLQHMLTSENIV